MPAWPNRPNYNRAEVEALLEEYMALLDLERLHGVSKSLICWKMDMDRAFRHLPAKERDALFLIGVVGVPKAVVTKLLKCSLSTVYRRYNSGLDRLILLMNGGKR